jgi:hypothetical protein
MKDYSYSETTGRAYLPEKVVRIVNKDQAWAYMKYGLTLLDMYPSNDFDTGKRIFVYLFDRQESKKAYDLWCKYELLEAVDGEK